MWIRTLVTIVMCRNTAKRGIYYVDWIIEEVTWFQGNFRVRNRFSSELHLTSTRSEKGLIQEMANKLEQKTYDDALD